jgi:pimeloyl-ACP methyl ester carboxylesterase
LPTVTTGPAGEGVRLYYEEHGAGAPILCIHGAGSSAVLWEEAVAELARHGRAIAYDRRGCARSGRPAGYLRTSVGEHVHDAAALLAALTEEPAIVIGRSFGGWVALELALRHPDRVRGLALLEPDAPGLSPAADAWVAGLADRLRRVAAALGTEAVAEALIEEVAGPRAWAAMPDEARRVFAGNGPALLAELGAYAGARLDPEALARIEAPVLLVSSEESAPELQDPVLALGRAMPRAQAARVPGGHVIDPASPEVLAFVDGVLGAGGGVRGGSSG